MADGRPPDYKLTIVHKENRRVRNTVGLAWNTNDGKGINIRLFPGVVIDYKISEEFFLTLWETSPEEYGRQMHNPGTKPDANPPEEGSDDPLPF